MNSHQELSQDKPDLATVKKAVKKEYQHLAGVEGVGIGDGFINIYVSNPDVSKQLPSTFQNVPLNCVKTGIIEAFDAPKDP
ncbi:MAG: hypothetical protein RLP02_36920 [Coleofasciculus sp. C2-GNP5-27]